MTNILKEIGLLVALGNDPRAQREFLDQTAGRKARRVLVPVPAK